MHYKLYKSGKNWLCMALVTVSVAMGMGLTTVVHADSQANVNQATIEVQNDSSLNVASSSTQVNETATVQVESSSSTIKGINLANSQSSEAMANSAVASTAVKQAAESTTADTVTNTSTINNTTAPENGWNSDHTDFYQSGKLANGYVQADDGNYYMFKDGIRQKGVQKWMGTYYYFDPTTYLRVDNDYREQVWQDGTHDWYMFGKNGQIVTGKYDWQGNVYYFDPSSYLKVVNDYRATEADGRGVLLSSNGAALSGVQKWMGTYYYFDPVTKLRVDNNYVQSQWGLWYMFGNNGQIVSGRYDWQGSTYYFDPSSYLKVVNDYRATESDGRGVLLGSDGQALSGVQKWMGTYYYFDPVTKLRVDNSYVQSQWGLWYMFGTNGQIVTGPYNWQGSTYYFDPSSYLKVENQFLPVNGVTHYFNNQGVMENDALVAKWESLLNGYQGHHIMIAVQSQKTGNIHEYTNAPGYRLITASTIKVAVLAQLLHNTNGNLTGYQQQLATNMIRNSDNDATTTLVNNYLGGTSRLQEIFSTLGMNQTTTAANGHWAQTLTTATDQLKLLNEIFIKPHSNYLNDNSRNYIKYLMSSVSPSQTWGISAGSSQYYIKNGWTALVAPWPWFVNSIGFIPGANNDGYTIAVYTDNNLPMSVGVNMIESLARATKEVGVE